MLAKLNEFDLRITQSIHIKSTSGLLHRAAAFVAHSGDSWFNLIALFLIWLVTPNPWHTLAALMAGGVVVLAVFVLLIKFRIGRKRPEGDWGAIYRNTDPHSFPSGHAARTAMLAFLAFAFGPVWLGIILAVWCLLVCLARVGLRLHYVSDMLGGILLGIFAGWLVFFLSPYLLNIFSWAVRPLS